MDVPDGLVPYDDFVAEINTTYAAAQSARDNMETARTAAINELVVLGLSEETARLIIPSN